MPNLSKYVLYISEAPGVDAQATILGRAMEMRVHAIAGSYCHVIGDANTVYPFGYREGMRDMRKTKCMTDLAMQLLCDSSPMTGLFRCTHRPFWCFICALSSWESSR